MGRNVKIRREGKGWNQEKLAEKSKVTKNTISDIETGQKFARARTFVSLAKALDTEVYELLRPEYVYPDRAEDIIANYNAQVQEAIEKIRNSYQ